MIDLDHLVPAYADDEPEHYQNMRKRLEYYKDYIYPSLTLDAYFDSGLAGDQLETLNHQQVISRYMSRNQYPLVKTSKKVLVRSPWSRVGTAAGKIHRNVRAGFGALAQVLADRWHHQPSQRIDDVETQQPKTANNGRSDFHVDEESIDSKHILLVSPLWMFQIDSE